ncbi:hypothetical protein NDU88_000771 [Pleurodeles waltl]|uniref:Uncharacterized protein n=1 Tax=Pleurodeles waltl TaxID=8319 RepID=A0AAV7VXW7_PLEWA|nr:hypothetical protein NDU88_000771 [Pleurodeles waltl]
MCEREDANVECVSVHETRECCQGERTVAERGGGCALELPVSTSTESLADVRAILTQIQAQSPSPFPRQPTRFSDLTSSVFRVSCFQDNSVAKYI